MTPEAIVTVIISAIALLVSLFMAISSHDSTKSIDVTRIARIEERVEIMWLFLIRRGMVEALTKGVLEKNSPVKMPPAIYEAHRSFFREIREHYERYWEHLTDIELAIAVEKNFGEKLVQEICIPHSLDHGACLVAAVFICRPLAEMFRTRTTEQQCS
jgi:hypothetical protein